ncbi:efflux RND transporter periplasmic adaptor subunit [Legionella fairfieldensis]|uniref:efflux RND transporter periplasmic adaptor subunit n=1 Tax=Legionella fairfieldensis TaxID=45064 RepID=UPI0006858C11|nr:efflux RND transporter periplasmic adaptor subunit [Legionella fairfieldensis]
MHSHGIPDFKWHQSYLPVSLKVLLLSLFITNLVHAHGEHFEMTSQRQSILRLSEEQRKMIGLKTVKVIPRTLERRLSLNGEMQLLPDAQADVSVRISGNVTALYANLGDKVKVGQPLIKVQSLLIGDPPPSVVMKSPMAGIIDARNVNLGQAVVPNTVLFHISNRTQLIALAKVYEEDLGQVKAGQEAELQVLGYPQRVFNGKVILIEPNLDPITRTVNAQILVTNTQDLLKPGMFTRVNLILQKHPKALTIPDAAIIEANEKKFVFKRQRDTYRYVPVTTGITTHNYTEILSGLAAGDEVVTQGNRQLYTLWLTGYQPQPTGDTSS